MNKGLIFSTNAEGSKALCMFMKSRKKLKNALTKLSAINIILLWSASAPLHAQSKPLPFTIKTVEKGLRGYAKTMGQISCWNTKQETLVGRDALIDVISTWQHSGFRNWFSGDRAERAESLAATYNEAYFEGIQTECSKVVPYEMLAQEYLSTIKSIVGPNKF